MGIGTKRRCFILKGDLSENPYMIKPMKSDEDYRFI